MVPMQTSSPQPVTWLPSSWGNRMVRKGPLGLDSGACISMSVSTPLFEPLVPPWSPAAQGVRVRVRREPPVRCGARGNAEWQAFDVVTDLVGALEPPVRCEARGNAEWQAFDVVSVSDRERGLPASRLAILPPTGNGGA